ncbi:MAG: dTMP kinase [Kiritimatiellae bacterium]|nr:dTMP kinase [Kiritimatiellia bacterium]
MTHRGKFITFEGPEGSGKTTHARNLVARLEGAGRAVLYTREPGGTRTGEAVRGILQHDEAGEPVTPEAEVFLFAACRAQLVRQAILPALERGTTVVCDRFADSTLVYQGYARGLGVERMLTINEIAVDGAVPDLTVLLDIDVETGFRRLGSRYGAESSRDRFEREARAFHERVRRGYLELAERWPARIRTVQADAPVEAVDAAIWRVVNHVFA